MAVQRCCTYMSSPLMLHMCTIMRVVIAHTIQRHATALCAPDDTSMNSSPLPIQSSTSHVHVYTSLTHGLLRHMTAEKHGLLACLLHSRATSDSDPAYTRTSNGSQSYSLRTRCDASLLLARRQTKQQLRQTCLCRFGDMLTLYCTVLHCIVQYYIAMQAWNYTTLMGTKEST